MTVPAYIVLRADGPKRALFRRFRVIAGPTLCRVLWSAAE